jgi:hypothetical protein
VNGSRGLIIATAAAFIVGCSVGLIGGVLFVHLVAPRLHRSAMFERIHGHGPGLFGRGGPGEPGGPGSPGGHERMLPVLERALDLTPAQQQRVLAALDRGRTAQGAVRESVHVWIEHELTPDQRERWKRMEERFERSRSGSWPHEPWPGDRPGRP